MQQRRKGKMAGYLAAAFLLIFWVDAAMAEDGYFPLGKDRTWVYQISDGDGRVDEIRIVSNLDKRNLLGKRLTPRQIDQGGRIRIEYVAEDETGVYLYAEQADWWVRPSLVPEPVFYLRKPFRVGTTWSDQYETRFLYEKAMVPVAVTIESIGETITVPAGTFKDCLRLKASGHVRRDFGGFFGVSEVSLEESIWFAPGIGMVKSEFSERSNHLMTGPGKMVTELASVRVDQKTSMLFK